MARRTVWVSDELDDRMKKAKDVNWSQCAADAFETKLAEVAAKKEVKMRADVIERLKASKREGESKDFKLGHGAGRRWAEKFAKWRELESMAKEIEAESFEQCLYDKDNGGVSYLVQALNWEEEYSPNDINKFISDWLEGKPTADRVKGFWHGAVELYEETKDEVEG